MVMTCVMLPTNVNGADYKNLDLVVVLDKSGSMNDADPDSLTKEAVSMLVGIMPSQLSRIGIVAFNRDQQVVASLTNLNDYQTVEDIINNVQSITYKGGTNLGDAVHKAQTILEDNDHTKGILVISDGEDDFSSWERNTEIASHEALNETLSWAKNNGCKIYTLGFNYDGSMSEGSVGYERLKNIAQTTNGEFSSKTKANEIYEFCMQMIAELIGTTPIPISNDEIYIGPYVKEANIYISSIDGLEIPDQSITLTDPNGKNVPLTNSPTLRFHKSKYSAVIKLFDPQQGTWKIEMKNFNGKASIGYVALYQFNLSSKIVDVNGKEITTIHNGMTGKIQTALMQNGQLINDASIYSDATFEATATITPRINPEKARTVRLVYENGYLVGDVTFNQECVYDIDILVKSSTFAVQDTLTVQALNGPIALSGYEIPKQSVNKGKTIVVSDAELRKVVNDPEGDNFTYRAVSSDVDNAEVKAIEGGLEISGKKWGSSQITVTYTDVHGNKVHTTFVVKVKDLLLMAFFASLPVLAGLGVALAIFIAMRQSRRIIGTFTIHKVTMESGNASHVVAYNKTYKASVFLKRKKSLRTGLSVYASEVYNTEASTKDNRLLYELMSNKENEIYQALDQVLFEGTYLGNKGCILKIKKGVPVSLNNKSSYGQKVNRAYKQSGDFTVYTKDSAGMTVCVEGSYSKSTKTNTNGAFDGFTLKKDGKNKKQTTTKKDDFEDFF